MFEFISSLRPHFHSLREIQGNISLDIKIPLNWRYEDIISQYQSVQAITQDKNNKVALLSIISEASRDGYDVVYACTFEIIKFNEEEELKQKLFQEKVRELEELFKKQPLDKLKEINLELLNGQENTTRIGLAGERNEEGREGVKLSEEKNDRGNKKNRQAKNIPTTNGTEKEITAG